MWARLATERGLSSGALTVVGLHVVDDNFLQPEPGTSAADHLVSGLCRWASGAGSLGDIRDFGRGPAPRRADSWRLRDRCRRRGRLLHHEGRPIRRRLHWLPGDCGRCPAHRRRSRTLWTARSRGDRLRRRYLRRFLLFVGGIAVAYFVLFPLYISYVFTHVARGFVPTAELGAAYEEVSFTTSDGLELRGWYVPSKNRAAVIAFPGRKGPQRHARVLARHGYGVLLFDRRGEGESDGDPNVFGWAGTGTCTPPSSPSAPP